MKRGLHSTRQTPSATAARLADEALSVSALTRQIKTLLEANLGRISVVGEIGSLTPARSGHLYLTLKDAHAVLDVVMWRGAAGNQSRSLGAARSHRYSNPSEPAVKFLALTRLGSRTGTTHGHYS